MLLRLNKLKQDEANDLNTSGGTGAAPTQTSTTKAAPEAAGAGTGGIDDMYGEDKPAAGGQEDVQQQQQVQKPDDKGQPTQQAEKTKEDETDSSTGYENPIDDKPAPAATDKPAEQAAPTEVKFDETGLTKDQVTNLKSLAEKHKWNQDSVNEYTALMKASTTTFENYKQQVQQQQQQAVLNQRKQWQTELSSDPNFGGEQFKANLKRVDTVLTKHFPTIKNMLTTTKGMLPPGAMKDLLKVHDLLHGAGKPMVNPTAGQNGDQEENDMMKKIDEFYS